MCVAIRTTQRGLRPGTLTPLQSLCPGGGALAAAAWALSSGVQAENTPPSPSLAARHIIKALIASHLCCQPLKANWPLRACVLPAHNSCVSYLLRMNGKWKEGSREVNEGRKKSLNQD